MNQPAAIEITSLPTSAGKASRAWDEFVISSQDATFFHLSGWQRVLDDYFGYECHYLYAETNGRIRGVLPLTRFRNFLAGDALISTPFLVYGGPVGESREVVAALAEAARQLAERLEVDYLELRNREPLLEDWTTKELYVYFRRALANDADSCLRSIPRKQRAMIRKGIKGGLVADWTMDLDRFYPCFSESYRNLGTPVFGRGLFFAIVDTFGESCWLTTVMSGGSPAAGVLSFEFRDEVLPYYGGGKSIARSLYANDFMYWSVMERASERGLRFFDFGRSKADTGSFSFKKHWGFEPRPLHYQYHLVKAKDLPNLSPTNPRYQTAISLWKHLPLWTTEFMGPPIARRLG